MLSDQEKAAQQKWVDFAMQYTKAFPTRAEAVNSRRLWRLTQEGMKTITVPQEYGAMFEKVKGPINAGKHVQSLIAGSSTQPALNPNNFTFHPSTTEHLCIKDKKGDILCYRLRINPAFTDTLNTSDHLIRPMKFSAHKRGDYTARIWALWKQSAKEPRYNAQYTQDNKTGQADEWMMANAPLFNYLSHTVLRNLDVKMYDKLKKVERTLPEGLHPMGGVWYGVAIGQGMKDHGDPHLDNNDPYHGFNCITSWGSFKSARLNLWDLEQSVELIPGDAVLFFGRGMVHNVSHVTGGVRNLIDLFCHQNVLNWHQQQMGQMNSYHKENRAVWVVKDQEKKLARQEKRLAKQEKKRKRAEVEKE